MINDPHLFTKFLILVYTINAINYLRLGLYGNAWYWLAALQITLCATWGMK